MTAVTEPKGLRTQIIELLGTKYYIIRGIWTLKPYYLGPWTFRVMYEELSKMWGPFFAVPVYGFRG